MYAQLKRAWARRRMRVHAVCTRACLNNIILRVPQRQAPVMSISLQCAKTD